MLCYYYTRMYIYVLVFARDITELSLFSSGFFYVFIYLF